MLTIGRFDQQHLHAQVGEHVRDGPAAGAGADDHDVVDGRTRSDLRHGLDWFDQCVL